MDVLRETSLIVPALNSKQTNALDQQTGLCELRGNLKLYSAADAAFQLSSSTAGLSAQRGASDCHRVALALREYRLPSPPSPQTLTETPEQPPDDSSSHTISLTSCITKSLSSWSVPEDINKPPFTMMESIGVSGLNEDCLIQQSRTCLGCIIETKDASDSEPSIGLKMADINREYDACSISDISMQCMSTSETGNYGDQLLSDQLLSFPIPKSHLGEKKDTEKTENDPDQTAKNLYEGLLLDKCNGEEGLLTNSNQDWGYFESFISESKMELLDLCSKNELSVNLFSEEDVDNYMFDDDDDSTLSSDVCSLKIRYESFQDNMREKTNVLQEETQFNFFPSVLVNCPKKESTEIKRSDDVSLPKSEELGVENVSKGDDGSLDRTLDYSPKLNYFIDSSNSAEDSGEYSDDSSSTGSSIDMFHEGKHRNSFPRKNVCSSNPLNYGLRAKRKARFSDDYLYDVDSIESEKNNGKREKPPSDPKEEQDDDWCPKKRRKSSRKEPPVIIKYIIINRFKGEKHMCVKLSKIDPAVTTVILNKDTIGEYEKLAPLKDFWQVKQRKQEEQLRLAAGDKHNFHLNGRHRPFSSNPPKRKYKLASRLRIQTVEQSPHKQGSSPSDPRREADSKEETAPIARPLTIAASSCASALDPNDITRTTTRKSRSQEMEERRMGNKIGRIHKFKSEARLRSKKMRDLEESSESMTNLTDTCAVLENKDTVGGGKETEINSSAQSPQLCESQTAEATENFAFMSATCSPNNATSSEDVATSVPVIPGGYLQTLLEASDSSGGSGVSFFPQQTPRQHSLGLTLEEQQFASLQLAQSCVLSPPSESELQQSPQNCPSLTQLWHSQLGSNQQFAPDISETTILPNNFSSALPMPVSENLPVPGYSQLGLEGNRMLYEKNYMPEQALPPDAEFQACQVPCVEGQLQFQRGTLNTDNGRLISFDSVGSLSATSSNYSSLSLKSCEKDGEDDVSENFLAHCSPKLVIQQSIDAITPLRESTDLLDISNFTPDKFRHTSLSELSPPETPNLSPQVTGREMKIVGKAKDLHNGSELTLEGTQEMKWNCNMIEQQDHLTGFTIDSQQYQLYNFNDEDPLSLEKKGANQVGFEEQAVDANGGVKGSKSKRKNSNKQPAGQGPKKIKAPRAPKGEKVKTPRQNSRASKKLKALLDEKGGNGQLGDSKGANHQLTDSGSEDWAGMGWSEVNSKADDQREFEEPSNILSNIVSGMAEVQRFMMASIEPIWGPTANLCLPSEANSLKLKTLKILAGTSSDPKKKGTASAGGAKGRKAGGKVGKNQAKFNAHPFFPQLALGCNMFDKPNLGVPGINGPAHKKMYRHKTSAKFPRIENIKGKRAERDPNKDIALMTSFEKLR
ncbi:neurite extension and migration factor [Hoplias malabaricus]|uniref:neurite extension and migration factor n=1 Tax=Hoplias malabaricus TaxID=27720 RepID=UPI0034624E87